MRLRGVALDPTERRRYPAIRGNVQVNSTVCHELGRAVNVARVEVVAGYSSVPPGRANYTAPATHSLSSIRSRSLAPPVVD